MKKFVKLSVFFLLFIPLFIVPPTTACTIFTVSNGERVLFGGNQDQTPSNSFLVVDKSGTFGVVYFATPWKQMPLHMMKGINEMGLSFDMNMIPKERLIPHPERKHQNEWAITQLMKEVSTVDEVLSKIFTYNWGNSFGFQIHFADRSGDAVVIHPGRDGELTYSRKPKGKGYLLSTNFNLERLDKGTWSCRRYEAADKMLSKISTKSDLTVDFMASVLNATHQDQRFQTIFSTVCDLQKLRIHLYYNRKFDVSYVLDIKKELAKTTVYRIVSLKDLISNKDMKNITTKNQNYGPSTTNLSNKYKNESLNFTISYPENYIRTTPRMDGQIFFLEHKDMEIQRIIVEFQDKPRVYPTDVDILKLFRDLWTLRTLNNVTLRQYSENFIVNNRLRTHSDVEVESNVLVKLKNDYLANELRVKWKNYMGIPHKAIIVSVFKGDKWICISGISLGTSGDIDELKETVYSLEFGG